VRASPRTASKELIRLDLPTFERPRKAISGFESRGQSASAKALLRNSAVTTFILSNTNFTQRRKGSKFFFAHFAPARETSSLLIAGGSGGSSSGGTLLVERN
jgi:hypothetical protein